MSMRVVPLGPATAAAWDSFVATRPDATFFHQAAMPGLIARTFRHTDRSILVLQDGAVAGVLPLVELRTRLFGHALISLPFCVYGGPLAAGPEAAQALLENASALRRKTGAAVLELRSQDPMPDGWFAEPAAWPARTNLYATFRKQLSTDADTNFMAIPRKQRAVLRKGIERGLRAEVGEDVARLHRIYAESVRDLGSPVFPRRWFEGLVATFPGAVEATVVHDGDTAVSGVLSFRWRDQVLPYYGGGVPAARKCHAYDFMYWDVMRRAVAAGAAWFDFGRSKEGTGAYAYKKNWGFTPAPLAYRFMLEDGGTIPEHNPLNPKYRLMIAAWKRLPLPVAGWLGPHLVRGVG